MTFSNPIELDTPENYPALDAVYDDYFSVNKTELYRQLGCMPELALEAHEKFPVCPSPQKRMG